MGPSRPHAPRCNARVDLSSPFGEPARYPSINKNSHLSPIISTSPLTLQDYHFLSPVTSVSTINSTPLLPVIPASPLQDALTFSFPLTLHPTINICLSPRPVQHMTHQALSLYTLQEALDSGNGKS
ncbi:hypothetical protein E2C01_068919 [Portunus trituberculatus]|uniref:Uncharacterized protein n=1 Tax=Portunus trituberculatus TaxID=210409 RepID=A0A5B7HXU5_PORTR|nr:hypothetical protein [Portunus trituberculatus]